MTNQSGSVRIFVAMPFSTMGADADWTNVSEIRRWLYEPVRRRLSSELGRAAELLIEDEKKASGVIYDSMFAEATRADVYIADLSGDNPNVFLELGVRWALRDGVTILVRQKTDRPARFNVAANRTITYGRGPEELDKAIEQIVAAALSGLRDPARIDSPVRTHQDLISVAREKWDRMRAENAQLREDLAENQVDAAVSLAREAPARALSVLEGAIKRNPASARAHFELAMVLRRTADGAENLRRAVDELRETVRLKDDHADAWRELGVTLSRLGELGPAEAAARRATEIYPTDYEAWSNLAGVLRRRARRGHGQFDQDLLRDCLHCYERASALNAANTYPTVNEARVRLLLSAAEPGLREEAISSFRRLENLARFSVDKIRFDAKTNSAVLTELPWKLLDLADCLLLSGRGQEGLEIVHEAFRQVPPAERQGYISSAIAPWQDFLDSRVLDKQTQSYVTQSIMVARGNGSATSPD